MGSEDEWTEVVPGLLVSPGVKVTIPHPDECWYISNLTDTSTIQSGDKLLVFTTADGASRYIDSEEVEGAKVVGPLTWEELVDAFQGMTPAVILDHTGEDGFYETVPLRTDI